MKEDGMNKLLELLNERIKEEGWTGELSLLVLKDKQNQIYICSKNYGFIKWLVDNDKIERSKVLISFSMAEFDGLGNMYGHGVDDNQRLLMILSIQDNPIEFLISILK